MARFAHGSIRNVNMDAIDNGVMIRWTEMVKGPDKGEFDELDRIYHEEAFVGDNIDAGFEKFKELMKKEMAQNAAAKKAANPAAPALTISVAS